MESIQVSVNKDEAKKPVRRKKPAAESAPEKKAESKRSQSGGIISKLITTGVITALVVGGASYFWSSNTLTSKLDQAKGDMGKIKADMESRISDLQGKVTEVETENTGLKSNNEQLKSKADLLEKAWRDFDSPELGIKFQYPAAYGDVKWVIEKGDAGKVFSASFSGNDSLFFGGITADFAAGREMTFVDTQGYAKKDDKFFYVPASAKKPEDNPIEPVKILKPNGNDVLIVDKNSFMNERNASGTPVTLVDNSLGALANLKGKEFKGVAFWDRDTAKFSAADFEKLLNSLQVR